MTALQKDSTRTESNVVSDVLRELQSKLGFIPNVHSTFAAVPVAFEGLASLNASFGNSSFTAAEQEIIALTTSVFNQCPYCVAGHSTFALQHGVDAETVAAIRAGSYSRNARHQALGRTTHALLENKGHLSPAESAVFLNCGYQSAQLLELLLGIAGKTMTNFASKLAQIPLDNAFLEQEWTPLEPANQTEGQ